MKTLTAFLLLASTAFAGHCHQKRIVVQRVVKQFVAQPPVVNIINPAQPFVRQGATPYGYGGYNYQAIASQYDPAVYQQTVAATLPGLLQLQTGAIQNATDAHNNAMALHAEVTRSVTAAQQIQAAANAISQTIQAGQGGGVQHQYAAEAQQLQQLLASDPQQLNADQVRAAIQLFCKLAGLFGGANLNGNVDPGPPVPADPRLTPTQPDAPSGPLTLAGVTRARCVSCHGGTSPKGGLDLSNIDGLGRAGMERVLSRITHRDPGKLMPQRANGVGYALPLAEQAVFFQRYSELAR